MSMSGSPQHQLKGRQIPKRVALNELPNDYSTTPGGSIFSTTPGGTKIFYDRAFLLECRNSPLTKSPPPNMAKIPGITAPGDVDVPKENGVKEVQEVKEKAAGDVPQDDPQFQMDI